MKRLLILAAGGHGRVVADTAFAQGAWGEIGFIEDRIVSSGLVDGWPIIGTFAEVDDLNTADTSFIVALGDNAMRLSWTRTLLARERRLAIVQHPSATVSRSSRIGAGSSLCAGAIVSTGAHIGAAVIVNTAATVDHDCWIGDGVHLSPGVHLGGNVEVGDGVWIGIGASIRNGVSIGSGAIVGAGAAVISNVPAGATVVGVPARPR